MKKIVKYCISIMLLMVACEDPKHEPFNDTPHGTISVAHLKTLCREGSTTITNDISIEAYVVANDLYEEYQKAIIVADESAAIEVSVDCHTTATRFPISARVVIHCTGLALGNYGGRIILGATPTVDYTVDRIAEEDINRYMLIDTTQPREIEPRKITIAEIDTDCIGNYLALTDVTFGDAAGQSWCDIDPESKEYITTTHTIHDRAGNTLKVRIIAECSYRAEEIPSGYGSLWGILEYFNQEYSLRIVNHRIDF